MTAHCMAVNVNALEEAGVKDLVDLESHTWTVEQFKEVVKALNETYGLVGALYCSGQGGDQGTRALVNNLCGGTFTNAEHTAYTWDDEKNIQALKELYDMEGIEFDPAINGGEEIANFYNGIFKMAFCWNIAQQLNPNSAGTGAGKTLNGDDIAFMAFPAEGTPALQGGIWGYGIFNNGDESKIEAAKTFIKYMCDMNEYTKLMPFLGDYYQVTTGWAAARTAWWNMLQQVGASDGSVEAISAAVAEFCGQANAAAAG